MLTSYQSFFNEQGILRDGTMAAIKVLSANSKKGVREFLIEINVIADIEHEDLVNLCGCYVEGNHRILVYGYLENNSLAQTLLGNYCYSGFMFINCLNNNNLRSLYLLGRGNSSMQFNWQTRRNICIGVAKGAFLHEEVRPHIVQRHQSKQYPPR